MIKAVSLGIDIDLLSYSQFLKQQGLRHRIVEESGMQTIYVESSTEVQFIQQSLESFINGEEVLQSERVISSGSAISIKGIIYSILTAFIQNPIKGTIVKTIVRTNAKKRYESVSVNCSKSCHQHNA